MAWTKLTYKGATARTWPETRALRELLGADHRAFTAIERFDAGLPVYLPEPLQNAGELQPLGVVASPSIAPQTLRSHSAPLEQAWERLRRVFERVAPELLASVRPPAIVEDVEAIESYLGRNLPEEFRAWISMHDGTSAEIHPRGRLMTLAQLIATKRFLDSDLGSVANDIAEADLAVRACWWHPAWVPITEPGTGDYFCLDLDPGPGGLVGQVIEYRHDHPERLLIAPSLSEWFNALAKDIECGDVVVFERSDGRFERLGSKAEWEEEWEEDPTLRRRVPPPLPR
ncbi:MAG: SMI1/KNR4 family protein [Deltaproteobacteria bacterium]|jgi:cell wall assembly regulator SMI1